MTNLINKLDELDKCVHTGKDTKHYTEYKPDCRECTGYRMMCEQKGNYKPYRDMIRK